MGYSKKIFFFSFGRHYFCQISSLYEVPLLLLRVLSEIPQTKIQNDAEKIQSKAIQQSGCQPP